VGVSAAIGGVARGGQTEEAESETESKGRTSRKTGSQMDRLKQRETSRQAGVAHRHAQAEKLATNRQAGSLRQEGAGRQRQVGGIHTGRQLMRAWAGRYMGRDCSSYDGEWRGNLKHGRGTSPTFDPGYIHSHSPRYTTPPIDHMQATAQSPFQPGQIKAIRLKHPLRLKYTRPWVAGGFRRGVRGEESRFGGRGGGCTQNRQTEEGDGGQGQ
jgi:hypothetical protein